jgi:hypothetical protein
VATSNRSLTTWTRIVGEVGDPEGTRAVGSIVVLLVALGLALLMVAVWLYRSTRPDPELLAPLEVMGERRWRRRDPVWQRRTLDELRPQGAEPLDPSVAPPDIDEAFDHGPAVSGFDDLHPDRITPEHTGDRPEPDAPPESQPPVAAPADADTPPAIDRPDVDDLGDREIDPDALAAAMADLDAELGGTVSDEPGERASTGE